MEMCYISTLPFVLPELTRERQAGQRYSFVEPQEAGPQSCSRQRIDSGPVSCMALDLVVEVCVRYSDEVRASVE